VLHCLCRTAIDYKRISPQKKRHFKYPLKNNVTRKHQPYKTTATATHRGTPPTATVHPHKTKTMKSTYRTLFDECQFEVAEIRAQIMRFEKRPKWLFRLLFTTKEKCLNELRFELKLFEIRLDRLRLKAISESKQVQ
jgi:hypothetical protein